MKDFREDLMWFFAGGLRIGHLANGPLRNYSSVFMLGPSVASEFHFGPSETGNLKRKLKKVFGSQI